MSLNFKKYKKDYFLVFLAIVLGLTAVLGQHFTDVAKTKFWWKFWDYATYAAIVIWVGAWFFLKAKAKK